MTSKKTKETSQKDGMTTTITVRGKKFELTDAQLDEAANRVARDPRVGGIEAGKLKSYISRIEKLSEDRAGLALDERDVFAEAKANGFCTKTMRQILKLRKMKSNERTEQEYMLDLYKRALGMQLELDLTGAGNAAAETEPQMDIEDGILYDQAKRAVIENQKVSASFLQRLLGIGYNRAARLVELLEANGVIGAANHVGKRVVLISANESEAA